MGFEGHNILPLNSYKLFFDNIPPCKNEATGLYEQTIHTLPDQSEKILRKIDPKFQQLMKTTGRKERETSLDALPKRGPKKPSELEQDGGLISKLYKERCDKNKSSVADERISYHQQYQQSAETKLPDVAPKFVDGVGPPLVGGDQAYLSITDKILKAELCGEIKDKALSVHYKFNR